MDYKPYGFNSGNLNIATEELLVGSNSVGEALNETNVRLAVDFKVARANQRMTKYVGVAKSKRKQGGALGGGFQSSGARWMDVTSQDFYHAGNTKFFV